MKTTYRIAKHASRRGLEFKHCYLISLFTYLVDDKGYPFDFVPKRYQPTVKLLSRTMNKCSLIHYLTAIDLSEDKYAKVLKDETIVEIGFRK